MSLKYVWICILIFFVSLMRPLPLFAQQEGPSGLLQYTFQKDESKGMDAESEKSSFIQEYKLRYLGDVYSPDLFTYDLSGSFIKEDYKLDESRIGETTGNAKSHDYNLKLDFIQGTKYPFTIYKEKFDQTSWTIQPEQIFLTRQSTERYGLLGNDRLGAGTSLRYDFHVDDTETDGQLQQTDQLNKGLLFGIDSRKGEEYINSSYSYQENLEKVTNKYEAINEAKVSYGLKPGKDTRFNMDTSYFDNSYYEFTDTDATMNFNYTPSPDFNSNISLWADRIKQKDETGDFATLSENTTYRIGPFVTTNQGLTLYKSEGAFSNNSTESLALGLAFAKPLPDGITVSADTSASGAAEQSDKIQSKDSVSYSLGGRVSKLFNTINSEIDGGASSYSYSSSLGGKTTRYGYNAAFINRFIQGLTFQSLLNFSEENNIGDEINGTSTVIKTKRLVSDNSLAYVAQLGGRGSLDAKAGKIFESGTTPRTANYVSSTLRYVPMMNLSLNAGFSYYKESLNNTGITTSSLGADYRLRSLTMNLRNDLLEEKGPQGVSKRSTTFLQVSRPF
jgi:hypothetical protein